MDKSKSSSSSGLKLNYVQNLNPQIQLKHVEEKSWIFLNVCEKCKNNDPNLRYPDTCRNLF